MSQPKEAKKAGWIVDVVGPANQFNDAARHFADNAYQAQEAAAAAGLGAIGGDLRDVQDAFATAISPPDAWKLPVWLALKARSPWNTALDAVFYHVEGLSIPERQELAMDSRPEGVILVVTPGLDGAGRCMVYADVAEFIKEQKDQIDTVVVAGVGSSRLGTAALARTVANCLKRPVAGVVSGYGFADLTAEAVSGWFFLGLGNAVERTAAQILGKIEGLGKFATGWTMPERGLSTTAIDSQERLKSIMEGKIAGVLDSDVLAHLLQKVPAIKHIVGHSKGNLVISNALKSVKIRREELRVLTLGAPVYLPSDIQRHQVLGSMDPLGRINTHVPRKEYEIQLYATHMVKPGPLGLDVAQALNKAGIR